MRITDHLLLFIFKAATSNSCGFFMDHFEGHYN